MRAKLGLLLAFVVAACAEDGEDGRDGTRVSVADLPAGSAECPAGGVLLTVGGDTRTLCNGAAGAAGQPGPAGAPGPAGMNAPGQGYQPTLSVLCAAEIDLVDGAANPTTPQIIGTDGIDESYFQYSIVVYANGDAQTTCSVALGSVETASGGAYYPATAQGAGFRHCQAVIDYPPYPAAGNAGGFWDFTI